MSEYVIITDSSCDISPELLAQWEVPFVSLSVKFDEDAESFANFDMPFDRFYDRMRKGSVARTSAVNLEDFKEAFEPWLRQGKDLLYIGFSSGLSTTVNSGAMAAKELAEAYPERKILVVDSLAASAGFGLLLWLTVQEKRRRASREEAAKFAEDTKLHVCHWFTVDEAGRPGQRRGLLCGRPAGYQARSAHGRPGPSDQYVQGAGAQSLH